ncbi:MAG TPA: hypothetical protein VM870_11620, partial [Pyrinomonadaceae bacterium]|nr:hypothetical protein [Pyrinomonadaceae bacterium]
MSRKNICKTLLLVLLLTAPLCHRAVRSREQTGRTVAAAEITYAKDVAPILNRHCVACHRPDNVAPMSLLTYGDAVAFAERIREKVAAREMPPWHADARFGEFANARVLDAAEIDKIIAWVKGGAKEGDRRDTPPARVFSEKWEMGAPDAVFKMAAPYALGTEAIDTYVYFRLPTNFAEDRWVQAVEFRPGNRKVVHHAVAFIETPEQYAAAIRDRRGQGETPERSDKSVWTLLDSKPSALEVMDGTTRRIKPEVGVVNDGCAAPDVEAVGTGSANLILSVYAPGRGVDVWPAGAAKKIPAGSNLILQMHYSKPDGETARDATSVALTFARAPVKKVINTRSINNVLFEIPPGEKDHRVTACWDIGREVELLNFMPHMHVRGKSMRYEAATPDGARRTLLFVPHYDFHWQTLYTLRRPLVVPGGTRLLVTAYFDNSADNMHNPDATKSVRHGSATFDEMMIGFVDYAVPKPRDPVASPLDAKSYDAYVGRYAYGDTITQSVIKIGEKLYLEANGQRAELLPTSETTFTLKEAELTFLKNEEGKII